MKKTFLLLITLIFIHGCTNQPFVEVKPLDGNSVVYIYVSTSNSMNEITRDPCYDFKIEGRDVTGCASSNKYMELNNIKPQKLTFSAIRNDIEKNTLTLNIEANKSYFLRVTNISDRFNQFEFEKVDEKLALQEIRYMNIANPKESSEDRTYLNYFDKNTQEDKSDAKTTHPESKIDKIKEAHALKEQGILTTEEFDKLKSEILNAN